MAANISILGVGSWEIGNDESITLNCKGKIMSDNIVITCDTTSSWNYQGLHHDISVAQGSKQTVTLKCKGKFMKTDIAIASSSFYGSTPT